ncbi:MAG: TonB-dependent receptor [Sphingobacteriales bacterium]|nr:TonB-dependent receptor [Sphingobacteriales bacterium]MBK7528972.1 TonB-dependent receptor [Sphingobacteriales bacterium]MBL0248712.1 TonB-dependent receptor [Sphingobacteriales bacterium]MCC7056019.1 TonB-dependent receptor [Chitinophagales bacterium]
MQNKYLFLLFFLSCLRAGSAFAQQAVFDSVFLLKEVTVEAPRISGFTPGLKTTEFDSLTKAAYDQKNLTDLLADESPLFIKSYGLGSLATTSFRGGSAYHTAVLWNGISLSSPMNGQLDLSLVPTGAADNIKLQYGGGSALFGSGAVAGVIHLLNNPKFGQSITARVNLYAGNFSDYRQNILVEVSKKKFVSSLKVFNASAKNDFKYSNIYSASEATVKQSNGELKNRGIISENKFLINSNQILSVNAWLQYTDRNIPPTMLQKESKSNQTDDALRLTSEWKYEKRKTATFIRAAWLNEKLVYSDGLADFSETSKTQQLIAEAETKITLSKTHFVNVGIHNTYSTASNRSFETDSRQNRFALFASYLFTSLNKKLSASLSAREELLNNSFIPFAYSAGGQYAITKFLSARANFSKVYRIPTFNDLYWVPGGNANLKPEDGYAEEAGLNLILKNKTFLLKTDLTVFNRNIKNWILWLPGVWYWSPQNIMNVWSRGIETNNSLAITSGKTKITFAVLTNYVQSTNRTAKTENDNSVNRQLIYTPMYSGMAKLSVAYKNLQITYRHNYIGYRYTSTDNTQYLTPYDLGSAYISYKLKFKSTSADIFFQANNIWNEQYQVLSNRAMPSVNINGGISIQFNKQTKS